LQPGPSDGLDTFLYYASGITNCGNYGVDPGIFVGSGASAIFRGLLRFPLNDIPPAATVTNATLSLWQQYHASNAVTLEAHRVTRSWTEGSGSNANVVCGSGATWYDAAPGVSWANPSGGGDYDSTVAASLSKSASQPSGWDNLDIKSLVQQWVS